MPITYTFFADKNFLVTLNRIMQIPTQHYSRSWEGHYMLLEIQNQKMSLRILTTQTRESRIPNARDNGIIVKNEKYQCITSQYIIELTDNPEQQTEIINLVKDQILRTKFTPEIINNIDSIKKSDAFTEIKYSIPYKSLITHEHSLDNLITPGKHLIKDLSSKLLNQKYPKIEREQIEKEIEQYTQNKTGLALVNTKKFYEESHLVIKSCLKTSNVPPKVLSEYTTLENKLEQNLKNIAKFYK